MFMDGIVGRGISDPSVIEAMKSVRRHKFVPPEMEEAAYDDTPLPIGYGQTISQPYIVAFMTEIIKPKPFYHVLDVGTGSGYQAAVLAEIVDQVYSIERISALAYRAKHTLSQEGYVNVKIKVDDGYDGWEDYAPYDAIVVTAAVEQIPPPLIKQLKDGGRIIVPVGAQDAAQNLVLCKKKDQQVVCRAVLPVRFVPFLH